MPKCIFGIMLETAKVIAFDLLNFHSPFSDTSCPADGGIVLRKETTIEALCIPYDPPLACLRFYILICHVCSFMYDG